MLLGGRSEAERGASVAGGDFQGWPEGLIRALTFLILAALAASMTLTTLPHGAAVSARIVRAALESLAAREINSAVNWSSVTCCWPM